MAIHITEDQFRAMVARTKRILEDVEDNTLNFEVFTLPRGQVEGFLERYGATNYSDLSPEDQAAIRQRILDDIEKM